MHGSRVFAVLLVVALISIAALAQTETPPQAGRRHKEHGKRFQRADVNGDGQISRDEWKRNPEAFDRLDTNHDGVITRDEAHNAMRARAEHRRQAFEQADKNHDGQFTRDEWPGRPEAFDRLDQNHDGVVTHDELRAGHHHRKR